MTATGTSPVFFATPAEFCAWLAQHHQAARELWVGFFKKDSGRPSITWPESVDEALCYGWKVTKQFGALAGLLTEPAHECSSSLWPSSSPETSKKEAALGAASLIKRHESGLNGDARRALRQRPAPSAAPAVPRIRLRPLLGWPTARPTLRLWA